MKKTLVSTASYPFSPSRANLHTGISGMRFYREAPGPLCAPGCANMHWYYSALFFGSLLTLRIQKSILA